MPLSQRILATKLLLVEGKDTEAFIKALLKASEVDGFQILDFRNVENFRPFIKGLVNQPDFRQLDIQSIGVIRDAEQNASAAFESVQEDLCLNMLETDAVIVCVEQYFQCLSRQGIQLPRNFAKAKVTAFLASRPELKQRVGYAMNQDYWNWNHPCLDPLKEFLRAL